MPEPGAPGGGGGTAGSVGGAPGGGGGGADGGVGGVVGCPWPGGGNGMPMTRVWQIAGVGQRQGRSRRTGTGRAHHRPLKRHDRSRLGGAVATAVGRGQRPSIAARITAASSSVGGVVICSPSSVHRQLFGSSSIDQLARVGRITTVPAMLSWKVLRCELPSATRKPMNRIVDTSMRTT